MNMKLLRILKLLIVFSSYRLNKDMLMKILRPNNCHKENMNNNSTTKHITRILKYTR